jgi:hypothetical protein
VTQTVTGVVDRWLSLQPDVFHYLYIHNLGCKRIARQYHHQLITNAMNLSRNQTRGRPGRLRGGRQKERVVSSQTHKEVQKRHRRVVDSQLSLDIPICFLNQAFRPIWSNASTSSLIPTTSCMPIFDSARCRCMIPAGNGWVST